MYSITFHDYASNLWYTVFIQGRDVLDALDTLKAKYTTVDYVSRIDIVY